MRVACWNFCLVRFVECALSFLSRSLSPFFAKKLFGVRGTFLNNNPFESPEEIAQRPFSDTAIRHHGKILIPKPAPRIFWCNNYIFIVLPIAERSSFLNFLNLPFLLH